MRLSVERVKRMVHYVLPALLVSSIFLFVSSSSVSAATRTWDGGGGVDTNWSTDANWSSDTEPVSGDTVVFDNTSDNNSTIDATFTGTVTTININSGYDGTITMARSFTVTSTFSQAAGSFTAADQALTVVVYFSLSNGTFTASSGTMKVGYDFNVTGGVFNHNNGIVSIYAPNNNYGGTMSCNNITFNQVIFSDNPWITSKTVSSNCTLPLGNNPTSATNIILNGVLSGSGTITGGNLTLNSGASLSGFNGLNVSSLTVSGATLDAGSYSTLNVAVSFSLSSGIFTAPVGTMEVGYDFNVTGGAFIHNDGTIIFDVFHNTSPGTITCGGVTFKNVIVNYIYDPSKTFTGTCIVAGNFTRTDGAIANPSSASTLTIQGNLAIATSDTFGGANLTVTMSGSGTQTITNTNSATFSSPLKINKSGGSANLGGNFTVTTAAFTVEEGTFDVSSYTLSCGGGLTVEDGGNFQLQGGESPTTPTLNSGSTVTYDGTSSYTIKDYTYHHLTLNGSGGTFNAGASETLGGTLAVTAGTFTPGSNDFTMSGLTVNGGTFSTPTGAIDINGDVLLSSGTLNAKAGNMTVSGNWTKSGGTFNHNSGTITLDGADQSLSGSTTFNNLTKNVTTARTLTFPASATQTIAGTMNLQGAAGQLLSLRSSSTGTYWNIDPQGTRTIGYLDVKDSNNTNGTAITTQGFNITDSGHNAGWTFDIDPPSISPTALSPDPHNDSTPTLTGTATEGVGTVSTVQFQMDGTSGSWTACIADDGSFNSSSEAFSCTASTLTDGTHTMYVRATDSTGNTTSNGSASTDTFVIDTTAPTTPGTPTTSTPSTDTTPTWSWTASTDSGSGLTSTPYTLQWSPSSSFSSDVLSSTSTANSFTHVASLANGTWYFRVKATDVASNDSSYSSAGNIVIDDVSPIAFSLEGPAHESYTNNERATIRWKSASDATSEIASYSLEIDNGDTGDFTVGDIPSSRTDDYVTSRYFIRYENFSDSDTTNNSIVLYTKSSPDWDTQQNDGKLREGKRTWRVKARDTAGNERTESRTLFVDRTAPTLTYGIAARPLGDRNDVYTTTDTTPTVSGKLTDTLNGDKAENKVASGPKHVSITLEKENIVELYDLYSVATIQVSNISPSFSYTPTDPLPSGTYRIFIKGTDIAENSNASQSFTLTIGSAPSFSEGTTEEQQKAEESIAQKIPTPTGTKTETVKQPTLQPTIPEQIKPPIPQPTQAQSAEGSSPSLVSSIGTYIAGVFQTGLDVTKNTFKKPTRFFTNIGGWMQYSYITFGEFVIDRNPTVITDVKIIKTGKDYAVITWKTNHHTKINKINYGEDLSYGHDAFSEARKKEHRVKITNLKPNTTYVFEVMSHGKNYVYDAHYEFTTKKK